MEETRAVSWRKLAAVVGMVVLLIGVGFIAYQVILENSLALRDTTESEPLPQEETEAIPNDTIPARNFALYHRCFGERQFEACSIYASELGVYDEKMVGQVDFPTIEPTEYESAFEFEILGIVDRQVVYRRDFWFYEGDGVVRNEDVWALDMDSRESVKILDKQAFESQSDEKLSDFIFDTQLEVIWFTTAAPISQGSLNRVGIYQVDLDAAVETLYAGESPLPAVEETIPVKLVILGSSDQQLFLARDTLTGYDRIHWDLVFDVESNEFTKVETPLLEPVFDPTGTQVAYIKETPLGNGLHEVQLRVRELSTGEEKIINSIPATQVRPYMDDTSYFQNVSFNDYGDRLLYELVEVEYDDSLNESRITKSLLSSLKVRQAEPENAGISIQPRDNPEIYRTVFQVKPDNLDFRLVKYRSIGGPLAGNIREGFLYEEDGAWFLKDKSYLDDEETNTFDLHADRRAIALQTPDVKIVVGE